MKILFIGKTMNYYIGDGINIRKADNTTGKVEIDVLDWKGNQLLTDFPDDFTPVHEKQTEQYVEFKSELSTAPEVKKEIIGSPVKDKFKPQIKPKSKSKSKRKKGGAK